MLLGLLGAAQATHIKTASQVADDSNYCGFHCGPLARTTPETTQAELEEIIKEQFFIYDADKSGTLSLTELDKFWSEALAGQSTVAFLETDIDYKRAEVAGGEELTLEQWLPLWSVPVPESELPVGEDGKPVLYPEWSPLADLEDEDGYLTDAELDVIAQNWLDAFDMDKSGTLNASEVREFYGADLEAFKGYEGRLLANMMTSVAMELDEDAQLTSAEWRDQWVSDEENDRWDEENEGEDEDEDDDEDKEEDEDCDDCDDDEISITETNTWTYDGTTETTTTTYTGNAETLLEWW